MMTNILSIVRSVKNHLMKYRDTTLQKEGINYILDTDIS